MFFLASETPELLLPVASCPATKALPQVDLISPVSIPIIVVFPAPVHKTQATVSRN